MELELMRMNNNNKNYENWEEMRKVSERVRKVRVKECAADQAAGSK